MAIYLHYFPTLTYRFKMIMYIHFFDTPAKADRDGGHPAWVINDAPNGLCPNFQGFSYRRCCAQISTACCDPGFVAGLSGVAGSNQNGQCRDTSHVAQSLGASRPCIIFPLAFLLGRAPV